MESTCCTISLLNHPFKTRSPAHLTQLASNSINSECPIQACLSLIILLFTLLFIHSLVCHHFCTAKLVIAMGQPVNVAAAILKSVWQFKIGRSDQLKLFLNMPLNNSMILLLKSRSCQQKCYCFASRHGPQIQSISSSPHSWSEYGQVLVESLWSLGKVLVKSLCIANANGSPYKTWWEYGWVLVESMWSRGKVLVNSVCIVNVIVVHPVQKYDHNMVEFY